MAYKKSAVTRQSIIESAAKLFTEKGYYQTNIKDIAKEAGIAHPCVYYYFDNKENIARQIYDETAERIMASTKELCEDSQDLLLSAMIEYLLVFKHIAMNKTTQAVFYDLVQYANYDKTNLDRVKETYYYNMKTLFHEYGLDIQENQVNAYIITGDAFAKALFKGIINGLLDFTFEEAADYFFRSMLLSQIKIPEDVYLKKFKLAVEKCGSIKPDAIGL